MKGRRDFSFVPALLLSILTPFSLPSSFGSLPNFRQKQGKKAFFTEKSKDDSLWLKEMNSYKFSTTLAHGNSKNEVRQSNEKKVRREA